MLGESAADADRKRDDFLATRGLDWATADEATRALVGARILMGDEAAVSERIGELRAMGIDGLAVNMPADGWDLDAVRYAGKVLRAAMS